MTARGIRRFRVPSPPDGFFAVEYQVTVDGRLAGLFSDFDVPLAWREYRLAQQRDNRSARLAPFPVGARGLVALALGSDWQPVAGLPLEAYGYAFDVVDERTCLVARRNYALGGAQAIRDDIQIASFSIGDGVEFLQCDGNGRVWVGYSDEGIANNDLNYPEIGVRGITQFSMSGERSGGYEGSDFCYCYALNVDRDVAWTTWDSGFALVKFAPDFREQRWTNGLSYAGFCALAVGSEFAVLAGGFGDDANNLVLVRLKNDRLKLLRVFDARNLLGIRNLRDSTVVGRGDVLHVICDDEWVSVPVQVLVETPL